MSSVFEPKVAREGAATVQRLLDENGQLIEGIKEQQNLGRADEALKRQQLLHRNLIYLAKLVPEQNFLGDLEADEAPATNGDAAHNGTPPVAVQGPSSQPHTPAQIQQANTPQPRASPNAPQPSPGQAAMQGQPPQNPYYPGGQPSPGQRYPPHGQPMHPYPQMMMQQQHPGMPQHPGQPMPHQMGHPTLTVPQGHPMQGQPSPSQQGQMPTHYYPQGPPQPGYPGMGPPPQHMMQHPQASGAPPAGYPPMGYGYPGAPGHPNPGSSQPSTCKKSGKSALPRGTLCWDSDLSDFSDVPDAIHHVFNSSELSSYRTSSDLDSSDNSNATSYGIPALGEMAADGSLPAMHLGQRFPELCREMVANEKPFVRKIRRGRRGKSAPPRLPRRLGFGNSGSRRQRWAKAWIEHRRRHPYAKVQMVEAPRKMPDGLTESIKEKMTALATSIRDSLHF
ncbi:unnamed protein product, partial [Mesorhabditis spiculigera]